MQRGDGRTLTGEHGVGIEKRDYMSLMHKPDELLAMWDVKQAFDPQNILIQAKCFLVRTGARVALTLATKLIMLRRKLH